MTKRRPTTSESGLATAVSSSQLRHSAVRTLAKSLFRELSSQGFTPKHVVALATALLGEVTQSLTTQRKPT